MFTNLRPPAWLAAGLTQLEPFALPFGGLIALGLLVLLVRSVRKASPDTLAVRVAVLLASAFSAQGMYEVATQRLDMPWWIAGGLFVVAEAGMLASGVRAHRMWEKCGRLGPHGRFVWIIATVAGFTVSLNARSASEYVLRLAMPLLAAGLWWMGYVTEHVRARAVDAITYRWSLRRLGVVLGVIEPGDRDLATVNADRLIRRMTTHAHGVHHGWLLRGWHRAWLRRLTLLANDDAAVTEVQRRVERVHYIESSTAPTGTAVALPSRWWLTPWRSARSAAVALDTARHDAAQETGAAQQDAAQRIHAAQADAAQQIAAAQRAAEDAARRHADALRMAQDDARRAAETHRAAATERDAAMRAEFAAQLDALRADHAQQIAVLAAQRSGPAQRSTTVQRSTTTQRSPRSGDDGERSAANAPQLSDEDAVDALLRVHREPNYSWRPTEVHHITGAGFRRIPKLLDMVAERHATAAGREPVDNDDQEHQLAAAR